MAAITLGLLLMWAPTAGAQIFGAEVRDVWPSPENVISGASLDPAVQPSAAVQALIDQLGGGPLAARDDATNSLVGMPNAIAPELRGALKQNLSADAAYRLRSVITRMDQRTHIDPSVITLHASNQPLKAVLQDLARQINADIVVAPGIISPIRPPVISMDIDHGSFWDALSQIAKITSLRPSVAFNQLIINGAMQGYVDQWNTDLPTTVAGPFRIRPYLGNLTRKIEYGSARKPGTIEMDLVVSCEPKIGLYSDFVTCSKIDMVDEHDHTFSSEGAVTPEMLSAGPRGEICLRFRFPETPEMGTHLKSLKGALTAVIQTGSKVVEFNDLPNAGQSRDLGEGASLQIKGVEVNNLTTNLDIAINAPAAIPKMLGRLLNDPQNAFETFDATGRRLVTITVEREAGTKLPNLVWSLRMPRGTGAPKILRIELPTDSQTITLPFELLNVALPVPSTP
jgi:hypothetical protein